MKVYVYVLDMLIVMVSFVVIYNYCYDKANYKDVSISYDDVNFYNLNYDDYVSYYREYYDNLDIVGILLLNDSDMVSILTKGVDNSYYLNHLVNKSESYLGNTFVDYRVSLGSSKKIIVYGHNNPRYNTPFSKLMSFTSSLYYDDHKYLKLITDYGVSYYKIFSVYKTNSDFSYMNLYFASLGEYVSHLGYLKDMSIYDTAVDDLLDRDVLILQTCMNDRQKNYLIVCAILMEEGNYEEAVFSF